MAVAIDAFVTGEVDRTERKTADACIAYSGWLPVLLHQKAPIRRKHRGAGITG